VKRGLLSKKSSTVTLQSASSRARALHTKVVDGNTSDLALIEILQGVMAEAQGTSVASARALVERLGLANDAEFRSLLQALANAVPPVRQKGEWVYEEAEFVHQYATAYEPDIDLPGAAMDIALSPDL